MLREIIKITILAFFSFSNASAMNFENKMYLDESEINSSFDCFHIHIGNNIWLETNALHKDESGLFTYQDDISSIQSSTSWNVEYVKKWKCPYCYRYWPIGTKCQNQDCPSKYG